MLVCLQSVSCYTAVHVTLLIHGPPDPANEETNDDGDVYPENQTVHNANNLTADPNVLTEKRMSVNSPISEALIILLIVQPNQ